MTESAYSRDTSWKKELVKKPASLLTKILNVFIGDESSSFKKQALDLIQAKKKKVSSTTCLASRICEIQNTCWI